QKGRPQAAFFGLSSLQCRLNFESPGLQQWLRNVLGVLIAPRPLPQTGGAEVLVWGQLELFHCLFERGHNGDHWANRLRLAPVRIAASSCHIKFDPAFSDIRNCHTMTSLGFGFSTACFGFSLWPKNSRGPYYPVAILLI